MKMDLWLDVFETEGELIIDIPALYDECMEAEKDFAPELETRMANWAAYGTLGTEDERDFQIRDIYMDVDGLDDYVDFQTADLHTIAVSLERIMEWRSHLFTQSEDEYTKALIAAVSIEVGWKFFNWDEIKGWMSEHYEGTHSSRWDYVQEQIDEGFADEIPDWVVYKEDQTIEEFADHYGIKFVEIGYDYAVFRDL